MSPWLVGFTAFFGYPLVSSVFLSFTHYDLLSSPRWVGLANYKFLFQQDQQVWPAVKNTLWLMVFFVPLQVLFAFGVALMLSRARRGIGFFRTVFYLPALAPTVAATLAFVYLLNPATGPVNIALGHLGIQGPLWFHSPLVVEAVADPARPLGGRQPDDHLPRRGDRRAAPPLRVVAAGRRGPAPAHPLRDAPVDQPGDPVRGRDRGHRQPAVLHAGVRRRRRRPGPAASESATNLGYPEDSTLFYPVLLYQQGFRYFNMGYASAMAMLLLVVALAVTLLILRSSRLWVFYQGAGRQMSAVPHRPWRSSGASRRRPCAASGS